MWDSVTYEVTARLRSPEDVSASAIESFAASADGAFLVAGNRAGGLLVWDLSLQALVRVIDMPLPARLITQLGFLPDNHTLAVLADDGHVVLLTASAPTCKAILDVSVPDKVRSAHDSRWWVRACTHTHTHTHTYMYKPVL